MGMFVVAWTPNRWRHVTLLALYCFHISANTPWTGQGFVLVAVKLDTGCDRVQLPVTTIAPQGVTLPDVI